LKAEDIKNTKFAVLGAGRSGMAITKLLLNNGAKEVLLTDEKELNINNLNIESVNLKIESSGFTDCILDYDVLIKSPGIPPSKEILVKAKSLKKKIYSEVEAASWFCTCTYNRYNRNERKNDNYSSHRRNFQKCRIYKTFVCGNVGKAFSEIVSDVTKDSIVVLELSSFQLEDIEALNPEVSIVLNITPDHLDWHGSFENYLNAKLNISSKSLR
jgi:UDP-N-acetylmuramoylalanine--D-glutamate ligase